MNPVSAALAGAQAPMRARRLSPTAAFYLQASIVVSFLAGSIAPTPLYPLYQARWGFSPITVTVVFGIYALAVLASLLTFGSLSDHVGRRPVLLAATALQAVTMLVFASAGGVGTLMAARVLQGIATGAAAAAAGAGTLDIDRARGTLANAVGPMTGTATGGLGSGLLVQFLPMPAQLVYLVLFGIIALQGLGVALMPETVSPRPGALASLRPRIHLPPAVRAPLLLALPALVAAWALAGFYGALAPALLKRLLGVSSPAVGGLAIFVLAASGALVVLGLRNLAARALLVLGTAALVTGVGLTLLAFAYASTAAFFLGTAVAGGGFGLSFQGAVRSVVSAAEAHERAGVLSVVYIVSYLSMGLPAIAAGVRVVHGGGIATTAREYGLAVMALAALAGALRRPRRA